MIAQITVTTLLATAVVQWVDGSSAHYTSSSGSPVELPLILQCNSTLGAKLVKWTNDVVVIEDMDPRKDHKPLKGRILWEKEEEPTTLILKTHERQFERGPGTVLVIPRMRIRPPPSKVRIFAKNKQREVRIASMPQMSVLDALKAAELNIQWQYPELAQSKVIDIVRDEERNCIVVKRIATVSNDVSHHWMLKVSDGRSTQLYSDRCLPSNEALTIRPGSNIDLIFQNSMATSS